MRTLIVLAVFALILHSPATAQNPFAKRDSSGSTNNDGYALSTTIWPERQIPVCWRMQRQQFDQTAGDRSLVRQAIRETWERYSLVRFAGWEQCTNANNDGISIEVKDAGPRTQGLGTILRNVTDGMVLNFDYNNWSPACQTIKQQCTYSIAVHEFGHALEFAHEQNRPDTPRERCGPENQQGSNGDTLIGAWDLNSVMNYCNPTYAGDGRLSTTDIQMVQRFYGSQERKSDISAVVNYILD